MDEPVANAPLKEGTKHAPGLWSVEREYNTVMVSADGVPVCTLDGPVEDNLANARLISAAPDLLAVLKELVQGLWPTDPRPGSLHERAAAAILKATSSSSEA